MASIRKRKFGPNKDREAWVVDYVDQHGKRRLKTFPTKKEAEAWKVSALHEVQQGIHTPASVSRTVTDVWRLWLADCEANKLEFGTILQLGVVATYRRHGSRNTSGINGREHT
jgi:hypothetical protein